MILKKTWKKLIEKMDKKSVFTKKTTMEEISKAEFSLNLSFPKELKELLEETNGIVGEYGDEHILSLEEIQKKNLEFRSNEDFKELYMSFNELLIIGQSINGDLYAYVILNGKIRNYDIFKWDHESDSRLWYAKDLTQYLEKRYSLDE